MAKVVQILTPNNNNLKKTTAIMLGSKNYPYSGIIFGPEQYQCCCCFLNLREERKKVQGTNTVMSDK